MSARRHWRAGDRGSASLWVLAGGLLVLVIAVTAGLQETAVVARHRAEAAADLAALAAAQGIGVDPTAAILCRRAARIAVTNGARLTRCVLDLDPDLRAGTVQVGTVVTVWISGLGHETAQGRAQAERRPP